MHRPTEAPGQSGRNRCARQQIAVRRPAPRPGAADGFPFKGLESCNSVCRTPWRWVVRFPAAVSQVAKENRIEAASPTKMGESCSNMATCSGL